VLLSLENIHHRRDVNVAEDKNESDSVNLNQEEKKTRRGIRIDGALCGDHPHLDWVS